MRSGGERQAELVVEVRRLRSGREHCHPELAVEDGAEEDAKAEAEEEGS